METVITATEMLGANAMYAQTRVRDYRLSLPNQLACRDKRLRHLQITPASSHHLVVSATLLFETKGSPRSVQERPYPLNLNFYLDDQQWRVDLLGLSHP